MNFHHLFLAATVCLANAALAADFKLDASGSEPLYQSTLPKQVYQFSRTDELQDLTITNAAGEQIPYALLDHVDINSHTITTQNKKPLKIIPIKEKSVNNSEDLHVRLEKNAANTSLDISSQVKEGGHGEKIDYLIDLGKNHRPLQLMTTEWQGEKNSFFALDIYASDDLKNWVTAGNAVFLKASDDEQSFIQNSITLDNPTEARYLKIVPSENKSNTFTLKHIYAIYNAVSEIKYAFYYQDLNFLQREQDDKNGLINVDYESLGHYPATVLRIHLPQTNVITNLTVFSRNKDNQPWQSYGLSTLQFRADSKIPNTDEIVLHASTARYWRLQFNQANGGLGKENPNLSLGWYPKTLIWNARGSAPFTLHTGEQPPLVNTMPVTSLIPEYSPEKARQLPKSNVLIESSESLEAGKKNVQMDKVENTWTSAPDYKNWLLWGGLFIGVLLLAGMAYSLVKTDSNGSSGKR